MLLVTGSILWNSDVKSDALCLGSETHCMLKHSYISVIWGVCRLLMGISWEYSPVRLFNCSNFRYPAIFICQVPPRNKYGRLEGCTHWNIREFDYFSFEISEDYKTVLRPFEFFYFYLNVINYQFVQIV